MAKQRNLFRVSAIVDSANLHHVLAVLADFHAMNVEVAAILERPEAAPTLAPVSKSAANGTGTVLDRVATIIATKGRARFTSREIKDALPDTGAIDQTLARMAKAKLIRRVNPGVYVSKKG
jgi:hypothetical protein